MPIEYQMRAVCDKCGIEVESWTKAIPSMLDYTRWKWAQKWADRGVMQGLPNRFGKMKIYCAKCAG